DFNHPPEIWAGPIGQWDAITHVNTDVRMPWGDGQSVRWRSDDFDVQGWLLAPANVDPNRKYPMIVAVHGGPASAFTGAWPSERNAALAAAGYFVFMPNPRGSYGQGEAFTRANVKDFGGGDLRDILAGVDAVLKQSPIDPDRIGIWGWSYGGYMTMWTVTQTNRVRAAVAGAGVADWLSYYGENDIDEWMIPYFGATVYDDPAVYAKSAPINFIKNAKTPTLVLVGERDGECPAPQSFEFWHALKTIGTGTQLVVYADEGHAIRKLADRKDITRRMVQWFDEHLR
ncbi:MAG TPA: alpha/beta fold hydrolase, partial [Thermoanaerobaculia bacterium]|nr:alpha/beta fold hydrolase [Thermoanaerobaculia bacterium]